MRNPVPPEQPVFHLRCLRCRGQQQGPTARQAPSKVSALARRQLGTGGLLRTLGLEQKMGRQEERAPV